MILNRSEQLPLLDWRRTKYDGVLRWIRFSRTHLLLLASSLLDLFSAVAVAWFANRLLSFVPSFELLMILVTDSQSNLEFVVVDDEGWWIRICFDDFRFWIWQCCDDFWIGLLRDWWFCVVDSALMIMCWCRIDFWKSLLGFVLGVLDEHSSSSSRIWWFDLKVQREKKLNLFFCWLCRKNDWWEKMTTLTVFIGLLTEPLDQLGPDTWHN
jgi:hypothetical protein